MADKFQNKYRIPSARFPNWDYRWAGAYFITIVTKNHEPYFGTISNGVMQLSGVGILADVFLYEIKNHTINVGLGEFVVMPDHVHLILILNGENEVGMISHHDEDGADNDAMDPTPQSTPEPTSRPKNESMARISPKPGSVSAVVRSYKSAVSRHAHRLGFTFHWQERFHDHVIRDDDEYQRIVHYIKNNPKKWESDKNRSR